MIASLSLVVLVLVFCSLAPRLAGATWTHRSPRLGILAWQAVLVALTVSIILACLAMAVPRSALSASLADILQACLLEIKHQYATPAGALMSTVGMAASAFVLGSIVLAFARTYLETRASRRAHRRGLDLLATRNSEIVVVDHDVPVVYCLPGKGGRVVASTTATTTLGPRQFASVVRHERAHLRMRHDIALGAAQALERAFPWLPVYRIAAQQIATLVEMDADDAVPAYDRHHLAAALLQLGSARPAGAMGAGGTAAFTRAHRLLMPAAPLRPWTAWGLVAGAVALISVPIVLAMVPGGVAVLHDCCPAALGHHS